MRKKQLSASERRRLLARSRDPLRSRVDSIIREFGSDSDEEGTLDPCSPALRSLQQKLNRQLKEFDESVSAALNEQKQRKARLASEREVVGGVLYDAQESLRLAQVQLKSAEKSRVELEKRRHEAELDVEKAREELQGKLQLLDASIREFNVARDELNDLDNEIRRIEEEHQGELSEVLVQRRAAYKVEKAISEQEIVKNEQDLFIARLHEKIQDMKEKLTKLEAQIFAQSEETRVAQEAVFKAESETERIKFEREQLLMDWDTAAAGVKFRLKTLERIEEASNEQEGRILELQNEVQILKMRKKEVDFLFQRNNEILSRLQNMVKKLDEKIVCVQKAREEKETKKAEYAEKLVEKEEQIKQVLQERTIARQEYQQCFQSVSDMSERIRNLEKEVEAAQENRRQIMLMILAAERKALPVRHVADLKRQELCNLANEKIHLKIELMSKRDAIARFKEKSEKEKERVHGQNEILDQYEAEIEKRNKEIDRNIAKLEELHREYEQRVSKNEKESGVSQVIQKIEELKGQVLELRESTEEKQGRWTRLQEQLLKLTQECDVIEREGNKINAEIAVLQRKRDRTALGLSHIEKENRQHEINVRALQKELERLGLQLREKAGAPVNISTRILDILTGKEAEVAAIQGKIDANNEKRNEIAEQLLLAENEIVILEHRLKLAENLKPVVDEASEERELKVMKKEISKMEQRLSVIHKHQELVTAKLESCFKNREPIQTVPEKSDQLDYEQMKTELGRIKTETAKADQAISEGRVARGELKSEIAQCEEIINEYESQVIGFKTMLAEQERFHDHLRAKLIKIRLQKRNYGNRNYVANASTFLEEKMKLAEQIDEIALLIDALREEFPEMSDELVRISDQMHILVSH